MLAHLKNTLYYDIDVVILVVVEGSRWQCGPFVLILLPPASPHQHHAEGEGGDYELLKYAFIIDNIYYDRHDFTNLLSFLVH